MQTYMLLTAGKGSSCQSSRINNVEHVLSFLSKTLSNDKVLVLEITATVNQNRRKSIERGIRDKTKNKNLANNLKGIAHSKMKILLSCTYPHVTPKL